MADDITTAEDDSTPGRPRRRAAGRPAGPPQANAPGGELGQGGEPTTQAEVEAEPVLAGATYPEVEVEALEPDEEIEAPEPADEVEESETADEAEVPEFAEDEAPEPAEDEAPEPAEDGAPEPTEDGAEAAPRRARRRRASRPAVRRLPPISFSRARTRRSSR